MDEQSQQRRRKLDRLREAGVNPYANDFTPRDLTAQVHAAYAEKDAQALEGVEQRHCLAGRITALRSFGKAAFFALQDRSGKLQVFVQKERLDEASFAIFKQCVEVGDIVGVVGRPMRTRTGELSILAEQLRLLTKALRPLPEKWHGLRDVEIRYRRRYLDLIANPEVRRVFELRARAIRFLRDFLDQRGFLEVETPMMSVLAGGATARPFVTHHNALDLNLFMRVAPELYLKRLLVGGLERVYELNRCFRNEGISTQHNPEFTMLEFYQAYATYTDLMELSEQMLCGLVSDLLGSSRLSCQGRPIELRPPFRRVSVHAALAAALDVDEERLWDEREVGRLAAQRSVELPPDWGLGKRVMALFEALVEPELLEPTFVCDFPLEISPLSRKKEGRGDLVDRFELYIAGREVANAFSELNDPDDQRQRFEQQMREKAAGDEEAMPFDEDYILALEHGMPPAAGEGIGIDRLVMLVAEAASIRDVILFPLLRPEA
ncbi:MAG: lysine--tRNA ligase [Deltaproteobacteria bacterium]|nr:lysine--tRNA ligase [Deltaproteobacteria bacterium]